MPRTTSARARCDITIGVMLFAVAAVAQPVDKRTTFTFSAPVAVPGVTLPAGQYLFRVADTTSRNVVQVLSGDGTKPLAQFFAMRATRPQPAEEPEVRFMETGPGMPAAIRTWWYPGETAGYEFVYPKEQARRLAMSATDPVLTTQAETTTPRQTGSGELTRISQAGSSIPPGDGSASAAPTGTSQNGEVASPAIVIATFSPAD